MQVASESQLQCPVPAQSLIRAAHWPRQSLWAELRAGPGAATWRTGCQRTRPAGLPGIPECTQAARCGPGTLQCANGKTARAARRRAHWH